MSTINNLKYGPHTADIEKITERLKTISYEDAKVFFCVSECFDASSKADRKSALDAVWYVSSVGSRYGLVWEEVKNSSSDPAWGASVDAAEHAIIAYLAKDLISEGNFNLLVKSWNDGIKIIDNTIEGSHERALAIDLLNTIEVDKAIELANNLVNS